MSKQSAYRKKLIEVAIPLEIINCESVREKYIPLGLPSNMHLWWARRPLAASRAVIFSMLIDDPSNNMSFKEANKARKEIFRFIEKLVQWENTNNKVIINQARDMINKSLDAETRILFDPFSGGAAIPIEAQRLGLEAYGSDLNPVATMIGKSLVELPYQIKDHQPIFPNTERHKISPKSSGLNGLISDLENYGRMIREIALKRLEKYYPTANNKEEIAAWLWCRTVKCQNPACQSYIPLLASSTINPKKNQEVYAIPEIDSERKRWEGFKLTKDKAKNVELKVGRGANFKCPVCNQLSNEKYIKAESLAGRMGEKLVCLVLNTRPRKYIVADESQEVMASSAKPKWKIEIPLPKDNCTLVSGRGYGFNIWSDLFTNRQLLLLTTYVDILKEIYPVIVRDSNNDTAYANSLFTYLAFSIERMTDKNSSFCTWDGKHATIRGVFARQAIPMVWDFAETNPFAKSAGDIEITIKSIVKGIPPIFITGS